MVNVQIIKMGPLAQEFNIGRIKKRGNQAQNYYSFGVGDEITALGVPEDGRYTADSLLKLLGQNRGSTDIDVLIGVVDCQIYDDLFSAVDKDNKCIIISTQANNIRGIVEKFKTTIEAYVLVQIGAQLLTIEYRRAINTTADPEDCEPPWHEETRSCVFDYSDDFEHTAKKLIALSLCESCKALLTEGNIRFSVKSACIDIVNLGVKTKLPALITEVLEKRVMGYLFSGLAGMALVDLSKTGIPLSVLFAIILGIIVPVWVFIKYRKVPSIKL